MFLSNIHIKFFNYFDSFTLKLNNIHKLIIGLKRLYLTSSVTLREPTLYPLLPSSFSLLYIFHILYPLNRLTTLDPLNISRDYSRRYHSVMNYYIYLYFFYSF